MLLNGRDSCEIIVTNDVEKFLIEAGEVNNNIVYIDDFDGIMMEYQIGWKPAVISSDLAQMQGIGLGDSIEVYHAESFAYEMFVLEETFPNRHLNMSTYEIIVSQAENRLTGRFTVVGIVDCYEYRSSVFVPVGQISNKIFKNAEPRIMSFHALNIFEFAVSVEVRSSYLSMWKNFVDIFAFRLISPSGYESILLSGPTRFYFFTVDGVDISVINNGPTVFSTAQEIFVLFESRNRPIPQGLWRLEIYGEYVIDGNFDIWLPTVEDVSSDTAFPAPDPNFTITIHEKSPIKNGLFSM